MVKDRLAELNRLLENGGNHTEASSSVNVEIVPNKKVDDVLIEVQQIRTLIDLLVINIKVVKLQQNDVRTHTNKDMQKEMEGRINVISQTASAVQKKLRDMGKDVAEFYNLENTMSNPLLPTHLRIKLIQYKSMLKSFTDIMEDYNEDLTKYHDKCFRILRQQRTLIQKNMTNEELDQLIDSEQTDFFNDNYLQETVRAKEQLQELRTRNVEIKKLEKSIQEIRDLFFEIAFLVERQGEQVESIEYLAQNALVHVNDGRQEIQTAKILQQRYRKKKYLFFLIVIIIVVIFIAVLATT